MTVAEVPRSTAGRGILFMVASMALLTVTDVMTKWLVTSLPVGEIIALRAMIGLLGLILLALFWHRRVPLVRHNLPGQLLCAALVVATLFLFTTALRYLPLAEAIVIVYAAPLFVTALAPSLLGESVGWRRWAAVLVGFLGVAVVMRPTAGALNLAVLLPFVGAFTLALRDITTRRLTASVPTLSILTVTFLLCILGGGAAALPNWVAPDGGQLLLLTASALFFSLGQISMIEAFRHAEAALVAPYKYTAIFWAVLAGLIVWGERPDRWDLLGSALIIGSGLFILYRERIRRAGQPS